MKKIPDRILIVKPSSLGDVVHSLPFLNSLRSCFPGAKIDWVIAKGLEGLLEGHPMINRLIIINKDEWKKPGRIAGTASEIMELFRDLRSSHYDLVIDLQGLFRSGMIMMATGALTRIGFAEAREGSSFVYNRKVVGGKDVHAVERYLKIAGALGCSTDEAIFPFAAQENISGKVQEIRSAFRDYSVIVPGARWDTKIWPADKFGEVASMLPVQSLVVGSRADIPLADRVVRASKGRALSLAGSTSLRELIEIMRTACIVISNDSGPMHIAAGFKVPIVAIFGPTSPVRTGPYGSGNRIIKSTAECAPCFRRRCSELKCMQGITVQDVFSAISNMISLPGQRGKTS